VGVVRRRGKTWVDDDELRDAGFAALRNGAQGGGKPIPCLNSTTRVAFDLVFGPRIRRMAVLWSAVSAEIDATK